MSCSPSKAREIDEDKQAMKEYGSTESGASLGDIHGAALQENEGKDDEKAAKAKSDDKAEKSKKKDDAKSEEKAKKK